MNAVQNKTVRDIFVNEEEFRSLIEEVGLVLAVEATRQLATEAKAIETPLEPVTGRVLAHEPLVVVPILRAGLGMVQPFLDIFPDVSVGYIGLERDHTTAIARSYYCKLPPVTNRRVILVDPMLATGGSAVKAIDVVRDAGGADITLVSIVCSPEGVAEVESHYPKLPIYTAALDRCLNAKKYILPGLGDFGDRLYGT